MRYVRLVTPDYRYDCPKCREEDGIKLTLDVNSTGLSHPRFECVSCGYTTGLMLSTELNAVIPQNIFGHIRMEESWGKTQTSY